ncbi:MAG: type II toxin-antitoxin system VapC family toxin [Bryobacteraceae bacterium]
MIRPILLDTNVLIWALNNDASLTRRIKAAISSPTADVRVSVVSAWEIAIKYQSGKLLFDVPVEEVLSRILSGTVWPVLPVLPAHIPELLALPMHHRDPFDRLLIAQARAEGMALATADENMRKYRVHMAV